MMGWRSCWLIACEVIFFREGACRIAVCFRSHVSRSSSPPSPPPPWVKRESRTKPCFEIRHNKLHAPAYRVSTPEPKHVTLNSYGDGKAGMTWWLGGGVAKNYRKWWWLWEGGRGVLRERAWVCVCVSLSRKGVFLRAIVT